MSLILVLYALMSLVSLAAYRLDKAKARKGEWRTRENTLLIIDLLGGWPGGLAAQHLFRHKNRKASYQIAFWIVTTLNVVAVACLLRGGLALD
ncbi:DUF1294 domain-containing protein [Niveibacterium terrae]|uniref:DUF1294 domain-containing protein n=1 Tax=Niveibacterium terrae TaxID=3373598 RepID=UPI003A9367D5